MSKERDYCPICGEDFCKGAVKNHIINRGRSEILKRELGIIDKAPHFDHIKKNHIVIEKTSIKLTKLD